MADSFDKDDQTVQILRDMALKGKHVHELVEAVFQTFNLRPNERGLYPSFAVRSCFQDAFALSVLDMADISGWHKFEESGYTDEELDALHMPLIKQNAPRWSQKNAPKKFLR